MLTLVCTGEVEMLDYACSVHAPNYHCATMCGGLHYFSLDLLASSAQNTLHSRELDVWDLSVLMHELLAGNAPFEDMPATTELRVAKDDLQKPEIIRH
jgi:hypothetical protein